MNGGIELSMYDGMTAEQIEAHRKYHREYYRAHKEEICKRRRENFQYDCEHGGFMREYKAKYAAAHREQQREANRRSYAKRKARVAQLESDNVALRKRVAELEAWIDKHLKA